MALKRNYAETPPQKLTELNKESMVDYVESLGKDDELLWVIDLFDNNKETKVYNFDTNGGAHKKGEEYEGYNMKVIRQEFAKRYFPTLLEKKKKKPTASFDKRLDELRKKLKK
ncbi:MAG: hypothetical protein IKB70_13700 [Bacilli bacterium]|nr:hypothetical protein [Bacilli bacterium]